MRLNYRTTSDISLVDATDTQYTYQACTFKNVSSNYTQDQFGEIGRVISVTMGVYSKHLRAED